MLKDGVKCDFNKICVVFDWKILDNVIEIKSFLGLVFYYRKFILNFVIVVYLFI